MKKNFFEKTEISFYEISTEDVITTSGDIAPWDPVNYSKATPSSNLTNDAGVQGGAN